MSTPKNPQFRARDYKKRVLALGFNMNQWAKVNGVNRSTIKRHFDGSNAIPVIYWRALDDLDSKGYPRVDRADIKTCPACFGAHMKREKKCPYCDYAYPKKSDTVPQKTEGTTS